MKNDRLIILTVLIIGNIATVATAQTSDRQGDYYRNEAPVKGEVSPPLMAGSLWQVKARTLNCRSYPDGKSRILRQFKRGDTLQVEVYRGGSDEVLLNALDTRGKPWMPVRRETLDARCYVRANTRYIQPVMSSK